MKFKYKKAKTLEERKEEYQKVIEEHPGKIGIICERAPKSQIVVIEKTKYLINQDFNLTQFTSIIRKKLNMDQKDALFFLANGKTSLTGNDTMLEIYKKYKDEDGFLYIAYASEEVWGNKKDSNYKSSSPH